MGNQTRTAFIIVEKCRELRPDAEYIERQDLCEASELIFENGASDYYINGAILRMKARHIFGEYERGNKKQSTKLIARGYYVDWEKFEKQNTERKEKEKEKENRYG